MVERQRARRANWAFVAFVALFGGLLVLLAAPAGGATPPTFSIDDVEVVEGDAGTVDAVFTVSASMTTGRPVTFEYTTLDGSATAGQDYQATSGTLMFGRHQQSATIVVPVLGDVLHEPDETFTVILSTNQRGVFITAGVGVGTIIDDDEPQADLVVTKAADRAAILVGDTVSFLITVTNDGPQAAEAVTLTDSVPAEFEVDSAGGSGIDCTVNDNDVTCSTASLANGASAGGTILARAVTPGATTNTATASSSTADPDTDNNTASAAVTISAPPAPEADLVIVKDVSPDTTTVGGFVTFLISVTNNGPDTAESILVTDVVPPEFQPVEPLFENGMDCTLDGNTVTCSATSLANGATGGVVFFAEAVSPGSTTNTATVTSSTADPVPDNNTASADATVIGGADLVASSVIFAVSDTEFVITTTITNLGPEAAPATDLTFTITQNMGVSSADPITPMGTFTDAGTCPAFGNPFSAGTWGGTCTGVILEPGQNLFTVFHVVYASTPELTARSEGFDRVVPDPNLGNNIDTDSFFP